jgi:hypothetical protein
MHASDWLLQYSQWLCQFPAVGVGQCQTITTLPVPSTMNYYDHSIWTKNLHKAMNRVGDTTPQEMPNISMRLQTKLHRNTLKVTIVSIWPKQTWQKWMWSQPCEYYLQCIRPSASSWMGVTSCHYPHRPHQLLVVGVDYVHNNLFKISGKQYSKFCIWMSVAFP